MDDETAKYFFDAAEACRAIEQFVDGKTFEQYTSDMLLRSAVERQFEILGEALNNIDKIAPHYRNDNPGVGNIIGMRNRIIHGYDTVDDNIVWDAIENHVPRLLEWVESLES
jgi:uncharacterized protein with HEPN domain